MTFQLNNIIKSVVNASGNEAVLDAKELLTGDLAAQVAWVGDKTIAQSEKTTKDGRNFIARDGRSFVNTGAAWLLTHLAMDGYALHKIGAMGYAPMVGTLNLMQSRIEIAQAAIHHQLAAKRSRNTNDRLMATLPEVVIHATLKSRDAGATASEHAKELAQLIQEQADDMDDFAAEAVMRSNGTRDSGSRMASDEGWLKVALHEPKQLFQYEPTEIRGMRGRLFRVAVAHSGVELPTEHPLWDRLVGERLPLAWVTQADYLGDQALAETHAECKARGIKPTRDMVKDKHAVLIKAHKVKCAKRAFILEGGLCALPTEAQREELGLGWGTYDRWAVNHATRRVWRDMVTLRRLKDRITKEVDDCLRLEFYEERNNVENPLWARSLSNEEGQFDRTTNRTWYLAGWDTVAEHELVNKDDGGYADFMKSFGNRQTVHEMFEVKANHASVSIDPEGNTSRKAEVKIDDFDGVIYPGEYGCFKTGDVHGWVAPEGMVRDFSSAGERERHILNRVVERIDVMLEGMRSLWKELRAVEEATAGVWDALHTDGMPEVPPVYWNMEGFFLTEEEALKAVESEQYQESVELLEAQATEAMSHYQRMAKGTKHDTSRA